MTISPVSTSEVDQLIEYQDLVLRIKEGNRQAFNRLYQLQVKQLLRYGFSFTQDTQIIEDCLHDVFLWIWTHREQLVIERSIRSYLYKSLKTSLLHRLKRELKLDRYDNLVDTDFLDQEGDLSPELHYIFKENLVIRNQKLQHLFQSLTDKQREMIYLRYQDDLFFEEIAEHFNMSIKACYKMMGRAMSKLREAIKVNPELSLLLILLQKQRSAEPSN